MYNNFNKNKRDHCLAVAAFFNGLAFSLYRALDARARRRWMLILLCLDQFKSGDVVTFRTGMQMSKQIRIDTVRIERFRICIEGCTRYTFRSVSKSFILRLHPFVRIRQTVHLLVILRHH